MATGLSALVLALALGLALLAGHARGECASSSDEFCSSLNRFACDPEGTEDLCGPCVDGSREGSQAINDQLVCEPATCIVAADKTSAPIPGQPESITFGAVALFRCKEGFRPSNDRSNPNGRIQKVCIDSGELSSVETCEPVTCLVPEDAANAKPLDKNQVALGAGVLYVCFPGYEVAGETSYSRTCLPSGSLSPPINCTDLNACASSPCGSNALCQDLPAPSLDFSCTCKTGFLGTAGSDGSGCFRIGFKPADDRVVLTAADLTLYQPVKDSYISLTGILASLDLAAAAAEAFNPLAGNPGLTSRANAVHAGIDATAASLASQTSAGISRGAVVQATVTAETSRAISSEQSLQSSVTALDGDLSMHRVNLAAEISRALSAETSVSAAVSGRISALLSSISSATVRGSTAIGVQQSRVVTLSTSTSTLRVDLTNEVSRARSSEAVVSTGVTSLAASLSALSSTVAALSTLHSTTLSMATSTSTGASSTTVRAVAAENGIAGTANTLRTDVSNTQTTVGSVSGTLSSRVPTLASISTSISTVASQVASLATAMTGLQASTSTATLSFAARSTQIATANTDITSQSTLVTTVSNTASTMSTTQSTLSSTVVTLTTTINTANTNAGTLNNRVNTMTATVCDAANGNLLYQINAANTPLCASLNLNYIRNWFNTKCWMSIGWRDSCNGCGATPDKVASMYASGVCRTSSGANNLCGSGWAGINTDGTFNDDDNVYVQVGCDV